ncbi:hypothetical protein N7461_009485 [Penicillium sp. DV-2018c]|nr:hypothetical protein N7461_009485 [Penicillium sp. DV-2018c]
MAFCITFGTHEFSSQLDGYEHAILHCLLHCKIMHAWTLEKQLKISNSSSLQPLIPLSTHKYKEVQCYTCRYTQDLRYVYLKIELTPTTRARYTDGYTSDRPDITPETRPPAGAQFGIQPPPQAHGGFQQQYQPPPQAQGGLGYK